MKLFFYKKIVVIVLVIAMILTTGGFVTLADSILDVIELNESVLNNSDGLSNKYYKEMLNENIDASIEEEITHIVNQDAENEEESHAVNQDAEVESKSNL